VAIPQRIAVLISGTGSNLRVLLDACKDPAYGSSVVAVLSDRPDAGGLEYAGQEGIPVLVVEFEDYPDRDAFTRAIVEGLRPIGVDLVCCLGFMRVLGPEMIRAYPSRIINIHPALLPSFRGAHGARDALDWGVKVTGTTVHVMDEDVDHGPIIAQRAVPVLEGDTADELQERIKAEEHKLVPWVVRMFAEDRVTIEGRRVHIKEV